MSAKEALIFQVNDGRSVAEAAEEQGVARSCAYKWVARYREFGLAGLEELSRRPELSPTRTSAELIEELVELKKKYPAFGPAKLVLMLEEKHGRHVMAVSTGGDLLARRGLVTRRRSRRAVGRIEHSPFQIAGAGDSMTADYKGQFRMGNGAPCYPLTIADPFSRYVLAIKALPSTRMQPTIDAFERVFREYGVPRQLITDNGAPFCSARSLGGLTQLSRWWIEQGITPIRIMPGRPDQNGIHERMHRTLKDWIRVHRRADLPAHQRSFDVFRREFNDIRPHQSLGQKPPATAFRPYRLRTRHSPTFDYDHKMEVRHVNANGEIKWKGHQIFLSEVLVGTHVGLLPVGESVWTIWFAHIRIGYLDEVNKTALNRSPLP